MELIFDLPLGEIVFDFYDRLKSTSKAMPPSITTPTVSANRNWPNWIFCSTANRWTPSPASLTRINAETLGRRMCEKLKELIPRQQSDVAIQAAIGSKIIARETVKAVRKDVTAKVLRRRHQPETQIARKAKKR